MTDFAELQWYKSSYRCSKGISCVEVAVLPLGGRAVRDSKNPHGSVLSFPAAQWSAFVAGVGTGVLG